MQINSELLEYSLCDHCLGRLYGKFGHGYSNPERGRAIRYCLKNNINEIREGNIKHFSELEKKTIVNCYLCENIFEETEKFVELILESIKEYEFNSFLIGSKVDKEITEREEEIWKKLNLEYCEQIKSELNREIGKRLRKKQGKRLIFLILI